MEGLNLDKKFITELKEAILESRYQAARLVNKELLSLYLDIGLKINKKAEKAQWGSKILDTISLDLQKELPGLREFSSGNLKKMRSFAGFWSKYVDFSSALPSQKEMRSTPLNQLTKGFEDTFYSIGFTHHYSISSKCESFEEAHFYLKKVATEFWNYRYLERQIKSDLYHQKGSLPNNFKAVLTQQNNQKALKFFKYEYLLDFINIEGLEDADERFIENEIVRNIKKFILTIGNGFAFMGNQYRLIIEKQHNQRILRAIKDSTLMTRMKQISADKISVNQHNQRI